MKNVNNVSIGRPAVDEAKAKIRDFRSIIPTPVVLTADEIRTMPKFGPKGHAFVRRAKDNATNPAFSLSLVNPDEFANDVNNYDNYTELEVELERLLIDVRSMAILSGSEAYSQALLIYKSLQLLSQQNIPGAKGAFEELRGLYPGKHRPSSEDK